MNSKIQVLLLVAGLGLLSGGVFLYKKVTSESPELLKAPDLLADYKTLKSGTDDPSAVGMALARLAGRQIPEGQAEALKRVTHKNPTVRRMVAQTLAFYPFEKATKDALTKLSLDPDENVRTTVLEMLPSRNDGEQRILFLKNYLERKEATKEELTLCHYGLYQLAKDPNEKQTHLDTVFKAASTEPSARNAIGLLIRMAPTDKKVIEFLQARISTAVMTKGQPSEEVARMLPTIYRHLVTQYPTVLKEKFATYATTPDLHLRVTALTSVAQLCPSDRWRVLNKILMSPESDFASKNAALTGIDQLGGKKGLQLLKDIPKSSILQIKSRAELLSKSPSFQRALDQCEIPKAAPKVAAKASAVPKHLSPEDLRALKSGPKALGGFPPGRGVPPGFPQPPGMKGLMPPASK